MASDPAALKRFESEAQAASALNHPNICTIYEVEEHEEQPFLVMELLEGQTLRDLIVTAAPGKPALELTKLLDISAQITAGLEAAHQQGIIHRDIKPANIFVTSKGQTKILDFGLAKLFLTETTAAESSTMDGSEAESQRKRDLETESLTASSPFLSRTGVAMGTAGYMSPEQIRGEKLDARTDLFSLGLVLYEMATGQRPFTGDTAAVLHEAILSNVPTPLKQLNSALPEKLEGIIGKALEKDRDARYQSASQMRADLESLKRELEPKDTATQWWKMVVAVVAALIIASAIFWLARPRPASTRSPLDVKFRQLTTNSPENRVISGAISPDGKYLAYSDLKGMHIKLLETGETRSLPQPAELKGKNADWEVVGVWLPGGTQFLANAHAAGEELDDRTSLGSGIWVASVLGGPLKKLERGREGV